MGIFKSKFPDLVVKEAKNLRKLTTFEEKQLLNFSTLDGDSKYDCLYGQITGHCFSPRAKELIEASCEKVYNPGAGDDRLGSATLNGSPLGKYRSIVRYSSSTSYFSPIEVFIFKYSHERELLKRLLLYIKGERRTL